MRTKTDDEYRRAELRRKLQIYRAQNYLVDEDVKAKHALFRFELFKNENMCEYAHTDAVIHCYTASKMMPYEEKILFVKVSFHLL